LNIEYLIFIPHQMVGSLQTVFYLTLPSSVWCGDYSSWGLSHVFCYFTQRWL